LPASTVNGGDRLEKVQFSELPKPVTLTLDRVIQRTVVHHSSTSYLYTIFHWNRKLFVDGRTNVWTCVPTDGHFRPPLMLLGQLGGVDLTMNKSAFKMTTLR